MKLLLISSFYNIALIAVTTLLVVAVLSPQEIFAFRRINHDGSSSSSASSDTNHIPLNYGATDIRSLLQFRGGGNNHYLNPIIDNDDDGDDDHIYTNIAGIQMDASFRGGGQYQRQHYSTATTPRTGGFVKRSNNLAGKLRRLRDMRCTVNKGWLQVTKGYSLLRVPTSNRNPRHTDAQLAVQVRGGADDKKDQNHKVVNDSTKGIKSTVVDVFYSLLAVALGLYIAFSPDVSQDQYVGWHCLLAVVLGFCFACSPFGNSRLADVLVAATGG